ncbi:MAG: nucleotidyltransferase domain-containing protein [Bacteroidales bacterium]|nr:nucleotidyltransferase domain-containing protein [Bacteroidales bacterium]
MFIPDSKVMLFASRARKNNSKESDYDFLVISKTTIDIQTKRSLKSLMRKELAKYKIPADILIQSEEEISYKKDITGHILKQALREGVIVEDSKSFNNDWQNDLT